MPFDLLKRGRAKKTLPRLLATMVALSIALAAGSVMAQTNSTNATTSAGVKPRLEINIPTVQFSDVSVAGGESASIPWIAQYIAGVYKYAVGIGAFAAAIMVLVGGFIYLTAGESGRVQKAKTIITDAVLGLIVLLGSYVLLYTINPDLTRMDSLIIPTVKKDLFETGFSEAHFSSESGMHSAGDPSLVDVQALYKSERPVGINGHVCCKGTKGTWEKFKKAAEIIHAKGCTVIYAGGWGRTGMQQLNGVRGQKQGKLAYCGIYWNCTVSMGAWCLSKDGAKTEQEACNHRLYKNGFYCRWLSDGKTIDPKAPKRAQKCDVTTVMHTTAVDAWAIESDKVTGNWKRDKRYYCGTSGRKCAQHRCQRELIRAWNSLGGGLLVNDGIIDRRNFESWHLCVSPTKRCPQNADAVFLKNGYGFPTK